MIKERRDRFLTEMAINLTRLCKGSSELGKDWPRARLGVRNLLLGHGAGFSLSFPAAEMLRLLDKQTEVCMEEWGKDGCL